jgi:hypothetical protein
VVVLYATLWLSLGLLNLEFNRNWWRGQRLRLVIGVPIVAVYVYVQMPALVFPQAISLLLLTLVPNAAYSVLVAARSFALSRRIVSIRRAPIMPYVYAVGAVAAISGIFVVAPIVDASGLRDVTGATTSTDRPPSVDTKHVRVVPEEAAIFAGNKVVGQLGAYYRVGDFNVQVAGGNLVWVAPLEFHGLIQWLSRGTTPGVIVVSAENPDTPAELRQREPMRYVPSALLNDNLYRHVYLSYGTEQILETTLQLDDKGDPRYLATLGRPTIGWSGQIVTGVVIVDPATGAMKRYARDEFASLPSWVSRVYPADLALEYNLWFGRFVHGLWNALLAKRDVHVPARDEVFGLVAGGKFVWFVDHTSPASDQSMTGFTYMDTVDGKLTYYTSSGGEFNSSGAEGAVASNPVVRQGKLIPTQPILYNAFGQNTWVVPLVADTGKYQTLSLVQASNGHVVVGSSASASPQADAFAQYAAFLRAGENATSAANPGNQTSVSGRIDRIARTSDGTTYFTLAGRRELYSLPPTSDPNALLARSGDEVTFDAGNGDTPVPGALAVSTFVNRSLGR